MPNLANQLVKNRVGRPTKFVAEERIREVAAMILLCKPRSEIMEHCCTNYGIRESSVNHIVQRAYQYIRDTHQVDREGLVLTHIELYYECYNLAKGLGDTRGAVAALAGIEKILKLTTDVAIQNNNVNLDVSKLSLSELKELLQPKV